MFLPNSNNSSRIFAQILLPACIICLTNLPLRGQYGGGTGTAQDPFLIATPAQMQAIGANPQDWDSSFLLTGNISLAAFNGLGGNPPFNIIAPDTDPSKTGHQGPMFTGSFNGGGFTISNFTWVATGQDYIALFGRLAGPGRIQNLNLVNVTIATGPDDIAVAPLVARCDATIIVNCTAAGTVTAGANSFYVGGLVAEAPYSDVNNCSSSVSVTTGVASGIVGGLAGIGYNIRNSSATGSVVGSQTVGGLVGSNLGGEISNCFASGTVAGNDDVGGLAGVNHLGRISNSFATGTVTGGATYNVRAGGLVGWNAGPFCGSLITACFATGDVTGVFEVGRPRGIQ